jgi:hypothetical protein
MLTIAYRLPCGTARKRAKVDQQIRFDDPEEASKSTGRELLSHLGRRCTIASTRSPKHLTSSSEYQHVRKFQKRYGGHQ